jgi:hypothetical protein
MTPERGRSDTMTSKERRETKTYKVLDQIPITVDGRKWLVEVRLSTLLHNKVRLLSLAEEAVQNLQHKRQFAGGLLMFVAREAESPNEEVPCD